MSEPEKSLKLLNDGRMAALAAEHLSALIEEFKTKKHLELVQNFRMGKIDQATMLASVSGLCALEDLENEIKRRITKAEKASHDLYKEQLK